MTIRYDIIVVQYILPRINGGMSYHDVSVDGDGKDVEDWDTQESVPQEWVKLTQFGTPNPTSCQEHRCSQGKIKAAKEKVGHGEVDDENGCCVPHLKLPEIP